MGTRTGQQAGGGPRRRFPAALLRRAAGLGLLLAVVPGGVDAAPADPGAPPAAASAPAAGGGRKKLEGFRIEAPPGVRIEWDMVYLDSHRSEKADLYFPADADPGVRLPAVVVMHGGGFNDGDKARSREHNLCTNLALNGYVAMSINYKLWNPGARDKATWPQSLHDAKTAVRWLRVNAGPLGVDPDRIGAFGCSAGGNLAAMLATTGPADGLDPAGPWPRSSARVACAVDFYGAVKLMDYHDMKMFAKTRAEAPELYERASPVTHVSAGDAPLLIVHGTKDDTVPLAQSEALAAACRKAGVEHELVVVEGAPHTFHLMPKQRDLRPVVLSFLDRHLKNPGGRAAPVQP